MIHELEDVQAIHSDEMLIAMPPGSRHALTIWGTRHPTAIAVAAMPTASRPKTSNTAMADVKARVATSERRPGMDPDLHAKPMIMATASAEDPLSKIWSCTVL